MDKHLLQKDVARQIGVDHSTITNWETQRTAPELRYMPAIIRFLGYDPIAQPTSFGGRLLALRRTRGLSQEKFAKLLGVDPGTLRRWETGKSHPSQRCRMNIRAFLKNAIIADLNLQANSMEPRSRFGVNAFRIPGKS